MRMLRVRNLFVLVFVFASFQANAAFDFNQHCISAYKEIFSLRIANGRSLIEAERKRNPQNAIPYLLDSYADYLTVLTSENKSDFERLLNNKSARLSRISRDDKNSPFYLFAIAEIHMQLALTNGYFQEYFASSMELKKAYSALQENHKKFPDFLPNQKNLGVLNAVLGALPSGLKRTVSVFGMKGDTRSGVKILENLVDRLPGSAWPYFYDEAVFWHAYVQTDILNNHDAYPEIIANAQKIDSSSLLRTYIGGYSGFRTAHTNEAISALNRRPRDPDFVNYAYLDYMNGVLHLRKLDSGSYSYFQKYLRNYKGINYIKDTYLNLAWLSLIQGNMNGYKEYINLVKTRGYALHEKDKQAVKEANDPPPHAELLRARLLFDGGFYDKALDELKDRRAGDFKLLRDKIEFCYRVGRIYDEYSKDELAIKFYQFAIDLGRNERYYFASNAAYRIGIIYEKKKNYPQAKRFFNMAIDMEDHDYERSIETKGKEGLSRISK